MPVRIFVKIVDSPMINQPMIRVEDRRFGRDGGMTFLASECCRSRAAGILNPKSRLCRIISAVFISRRIDQPKRNFVGVRRSEPIDRRSIAIGNRAIGAYKDENGNLAGSRLQRIHCCPGQIHYRGLRAIRRSALGKEISADHKNDQRQRDTSEGTRATHRCPNRRAILHLMP